MYKKYGQAAGGKMGGERMTALGAVRDARQIARKLEALSFLQGLAFLLFSVVVAPQDKARATTPAVDSGSGQ